MSPDREGNREVTGKWEVGSGVGWAKFEKGGGGIGNIEVVFIKWVITSLPTL